MRYRFLYALPAVAAYQSKRFLQMSSLLTTSNRVAVIGGGLSGILAGQELTKLSCNPKIFEASKPGGLWESNRNRTWDSLKTNLSKYTCVVSNHDWPGHVAEFPTRNDVEVYIRSISNSLDILSETTITKVELMPSMNGSNESAYKVHYIHNTSGEPREEIFDKVIVCSGFFTKSDAPKVDTTEFGGRILSSNDYRNASSFQGHKVVVVGGSFSGCEIAAELAKEGAEVYHCVSSHAYVLPTFLPEDPCNPATAFLPIDSVLYKVTDRRLEQIEKALCKENEDEKVELLFKTPIEDKQTHKYFESVLGVNNDILHSAEIPKPQKARVVISDDYRRMVKSGKIFVHHGKLRKLSNHMMTISSKCESGDEEVQFACDFPIDDCILATGFSPDSSIFCDNIRDLLEVPLHPEHLDNQFMPYLLDREVMHPDLPGLYFVGMYKGTYFGVIELQAKLVAGYVAEKFPLPSRESMIRGIELARQRRQQQPRSHFPHPDYVGMMFDYAKELGQIPSSHFRQNHRFITPHYFCGREDAMLALEKSIENSRNGKYVAKHIFRALENQSWTFHRTIDDRKNNTKMQVRGKVSFSPIGWDGRYLLYKEEGKMILANGMEFDTTHYYVYHYNSDEDTLDILFSTVGKPEIIDRPFISMSFIPTSSGWESKAYHLCGCDNYNSKYIFQFQGLSIPTFQVQFDVEGPEKDYLAITNFHIVE